eukprot:15548634-Heterocapsa_arctica.AAC.1
MKLLARNDVADSLRDDLRRPDHRPATTWPTQFEMIYDAPDHRPATTWPNLLRDDLRRPDHRPQRKCGLRKTTLLRRHPLRAVEQTPQGATRCRDSRPCASSVWTWVEASSVEQAALRLEPGTC